MTIGQWWSLEQHTVKAIRVIRGRGIEKDECFGGCGVRAQRIPVHKIRRGLQYIIAAGNAQVIHLELEIGRKICGSERAGRHEKEHAGRDAE